MTAGARSVVIHGHFYQPPREDPWLDQIPRQSSAHPFHDWNERIERECYRAVAAARIPGEEGRIVKILNTLELISFNFGPTLMEWLEREAPETYAAILRADESSRARLGGHGNAMAMPYHHPILPLASRRDKVTEVRWGLADFRQRFGREAEGMWLPETAVDGETLDVLASEGVRFTVVAPHQVKPVPEAGLPCLYRTAAGRAIALFVYDGDLSHDVAFGTLLKDASLWASRILAHAPRGMRDLAAMATDGETFGHHHRFGEMALAAVLDGLLRGKEVRVENFASFLARNPPTTEVELEEPSSWSCTHGVERWRSDCGCKMDPKKESQQEWRAPLRDAMDWLASELDRVFEREASAFFQDPWVARDAYGAVLGADEDGLTSFVRDYGARALNDAEVVRALELLELERSALRLFTSCGWFFDDIAGIESLQILRYAAHALELAGPEGPQLEEGLKERLAPALSNDPAEGNGTRIYEQRVKPPIHSMIRAAAAAGTLRHVDPERALQRVGAYRVEMEGSRVRIAHSRTGRAHELDVRVERGATEPLIITAETESASHRLQLDDLPDPQRKEIANRLKESIVDAWFTAEELRRLRCGDGSFGEVAAGAVKRAFRSLGEDTGTEGIRRAVDLANLLQLAAVPIPFDIQTQFWRVWTSRPVGGSDGALVALGQQLGFVFPEEEG
jgi:hypothetical protein